MGVVWGGYISLWFSSRGHFLLSFCRFQVKHSELGEELEEEADGKTGKSETKHHKDPPRKIAEIYTRLL